MRGRISVKSVVALVLGAVAGAAAVAAAQSVEVTDSAGDVKNKPEPWQDLVGIGVGREGDTFTFSMEVAAALPEDPPAASGGLGWFLWNWGIDVDPDLAPEGWPFPKSHPGPQDFLVCFVADGGEYFAFVADRRPLVLGLEPVITAVPCRVDGARIEVEVDAHLLDDPAEFMWYGGTVTFHSQLESDGFQRVDQAPDVPVLAPWPGE